MGKGTRRTAFREYVVTSLGELIDVVTPEAPDPVTGRRWYGDIFRGVTGPDLPLYTSLDRLGANDPPHAHADLEEHILRNFIRYSRAHIPARPSNDWELLVTAQHHGLPTRLLDWTYSPLVAAHFATAHLALSGAGEALIWRLDWKAVHRRFGLPEIALIIDDLEHRLGNPAEPLTPWRMFRRGRNADPVACMLEPPSLDARIVAQSAAFTICSDKWVSFDRFLIEHGLADALSRLVIPHTELARFRDQLDMVGVDERRMFPDLDGVAARMRRHYS